jgi:hypothetical protein
VLAVLPLLELVAGGLGSSMLMLLDDMSIVRPDVLHNRSEVERSFNQAGRAPKPRDLAAGSPVLTPQATVCLAWGRASRRIDVDGPFGRS